MGRNTPCNSEIARTSIETTLPGLYTGGIPISISAPFLKFAQPGGSLSHRGTSSIVAMPNFSLASPADNLYIKTVVGESACPMKIRNRAQKLAKPPPLRTPRSFRLSFCPPSFCQFSFRPQRFCGASSCGASLCPKNETFWDKNRGGVKMEHSTTTTCTFENGTVVPFWQPSLVRSFAVICGFRQDRSADSLYSLSARSSSLVANKDLSTNSRTGLSALRTQVSRYNEVARISGDALTSKVSCLLRAALQPRCLTCSFGTRTFGMRQRSFWIG